MPLLKGWSMTLLDNPSVYRLANALRLSRTDLAIIAHWNKEPSPSELSPSSLRSWALAMITGKWTAVVVDVSASVLAEELARMLEDAQEIRALNSDIEFLTVARETYTTPIVALNRLQRAYICLRMARRIAGYQSTEALKQELARIDCDSCRLQELIDSGWMRTIVLDIDRAEWPMVFAAGMAENYQKKPIPSDVEITRKMQKIAGEKNIER